MGIIRAFDVACDKCGHLNDDPQCSATTLRQKLKQDGWTISGNKFTCGNCNGNWKQEPESDPAA
jgi:hypothetical protein